MKAGKSKKSSAPSSAQKEKSVPSKAKSANVKASAAKASAPKQTTKKEPVRTPAAKEAEVKTKTPSSAQQAKKAQPAGAQSPTPIVVSAIKKATATPGIPPEMIPTEPAATPKLQKKVMPRVKSARKPKAEKATPPMPASVVVSAIKEVTSTPGISPKAIAAAAAEAPSEKSQTTAKESVPLAAPASALNVRPPSAVRSLEPAAESKPRFVRQPRPVPVEIPPILLEPDHVPTEPAIAGPGARFALTPTLESTLSEAPKELPESYGTQQIFLAARDPYCLFASWDLDAKQRTRYNAESASGALTIRLRKGFVEGPIVLEVHAAPNSRDRFIDVGQPDTTFVAELGYHEKNSGAWRQISVSKAVTTPRDRMAPMIAAVGTGVSVEAPVAPPTEPHLWRETETPRGDGRAFESQRRRDEIIFAMQAPQQESRWFVQPEAYREEPRWQPEPEQPRRKSEPARSKAPRYRIVAAPKWSAAKMKALDELISLEFRRTQQGSLEIEEVLRRSILRTAEEWEQAPSSLELIEELGPEEMEALGLTQPQAPSSLELAARAGAGKKGFWFKVNAELIIYGSTEPDAHVSIGGRPIRLRRDGTFSYRFALPDGAYELPVIALSRDSDDGRAAELRFSRATRYSGEVGAHPQDAALKAPAAENL